MSSKIFLFSQKNKECQGRKELKFKQFIFACLALILVFLREA
jgi:hypothetical protein